MFEGGIVKALGTMSGTSLDGVDAAVIETDGVTITGFGPSSYRAYTREEQAVLRAHLGRWPEDGCDAAAAIVEGAHQDVFLQFSDYDLAGFHGQTLAHDPARGRTHQCGDGARLAQLIGRPVAWDFRTADVAAGGQGAPLAPFYHFALAKWLGADAPLAMLNLGGVGNITWIDPRLDAPEEAGALLAFDTGPANAPMNDLMQARRGLPYDADGALAAQGQADQGTVDAFLAHPYFAAPPPKSLDRDAFEALTEQVSRLDDADALATVGEAIAQSVALALSACPVPPLRLLVTGGGRRNAALMRRLSAAVKFTVEPVESVGLDGDMLEAQAFGYLAVRVARGLPLSAPSTTGVPAPILGGRISRRA
jgi:anhydro-N-acetylmuramic acid kinase